MNKEMQKRRDKFAWVDKMGGGHIRQDVQLGWDKCAEIYEKEKIAPLVEELRFVAVQMEHQVPMHLVAKFVRKLLERLGFKDG